MNTELDDLVLAAALRAPRTPVKASGAPLTFLALCEAVEIVTVADLRARSTLVQAWLGKLPLASANLVSLALRTWLLQVATSPKGGKPAPEQAAADPDHDPTAYHPRNNPEPHRGVPSMLAEVEVWAKDNGAHDAGRTHPAPDLARKSTSKCSCALELARESTSECSAVLKLARFCTPKCSSELPVGSDEHSEVLPHAAVELRRARRSARTSRSRPSRSTSECPPSLTARCAPDRPRVSPLVRAVPRSSELHAQLVSGRRVGGSVVDVRQAWTA